jgi:NADPH:quinone reductase-like Zn-dependent oxidoreductase
MRVVQFRACGGSEVLKWGDDPDPRAGRRRIRVAVGAAGLNPVDGKTFAGTMSGGRWGDLREADRG